jgi:tellurium resistance protein TerZ
MARVDARALRRADTRGFAEDMDLPKTRYGFGASWTSLGGRDVDIDLQCVVVDFSGAIIDCAYFNNLKAARAITHSGDETAGKPNNIEEMVWVNVQKLPPNVAMLAFVVAAYSGGSLKDVKNGQLHVLEEHESREIAVFDWNRSTASINIVAAMFRDPLDGSGPRTSWSWKLRVIDESVHEGRHFMDILPQLSTVIRGFLPHAPQRQKVAFAMEKGGVLDLPAGLNQITVGLGWDVDEGECDLDVSAVLMDSDGRDAEAVFFGRLESEEHGIQHTGDNLTGEGDGDDEQIIVNLDRIGGSIQQVFFVVNIYTPHRNFMQVAEPFCRILDNSTGAELCRYSLRDAGSESGLIIARIAREAGGRWAFHALGLPCRGRTYKDSIPQLRAACKVKTSSLMLRSQSSGSNLGDSQLDVPVQFPSPFEVSAAPTQKCCVMM